MSVITVKRSTTIFENTRFQVFADHIVDGIGNEVENYLVVSPRNRSNRLVTGVAVVPVLDGRILFLNIYRHAVRRRVLELPRGFLDENEEPQEAASRELSEETGIVCPSDVLVSLGFIQPEPGLLSARVALFAATQCRLGGQPQEDEIGIDERLWLPIAEVRRMLCSFEVEDSATCTALHRYFLLLDAREGAA